MPLDDNGNGVAEMDGSTLEAGRTTLMDETSVETRVVDVM